MEKDLIILAIVIGVLSLIALYACLKVASDDDDRNNRD